MIVFDDEIEKVLARIARTADGRVLHIFLQRAMMALSPSPESGALQVFEGGRRFAQQIKAAMDRPSRRKQVADPANPNPTSAAPSSSSPPAAPPTSAAPAPAAASPPAPVAAPAAPATSAAPQRPSYVRDDEWDPVNGKIIDAKLEGRINGLTAFEAAEQSRKLSIPKPEAYQPVLPKDFKAPEGVTFEINKDDPIIAQARVLANKRGLDQDGFSEFLGLYAATKVGEQQQFKAAYDAEVGKLGATATARVTAVQTWLRAMGGQEAEPLAKVLALAPVADTIVALENLMKKFSGGTGFNQSGRENGHVEMTDEKWNSMSYAEKRAYGKRDKAA